MSEDRIPRRISPDDFGAPPDDEWFEPAGDLASFLKDDPEVDWTNLWVRRGAHDEMAGVAAGANPYRPQRVDADLLSGVPGPRAKAWLQGWKASGHHHGRFDRAKDNAARAAFEDYVRKMPPDFNPLGRDLDDQ